MAEKDMYQKLEDMKAYLRELGSVVIAASGGVDSTLLAKVAHDVLGDNMMAVTALARSTPRREINEASDFCEREGINHVVLEYNEFEVPGFSENPPNRCYLCKKALFTGMDELREKNGFAYLCEGSNVDDEGDYRPGLQALSELGTKSPLRAAGLRKAEIRALSHELGLPTWNKPSAACLSSRFPYLHTITEEKLQMVDTAEDFLRDLGFGQVRVRVLEDTARIELEREELSRAMEPEVREAISSRLHEIGFLYVSLDMDGFRSGSMNAVLGK